jgi:hypothetical protein
MIFCARRISWGSLIIACLVYIGHRVSGARRKWRRRRGSGGGWWVASPLLSSALSLIAPQSRIRIDGVRIDHLQNSIGMTQGGPISWITSGKLDAVLDIKFPRDSSSELALSAILDAITQGWEVIPGQRELAKPPLSAPEDEEQVVGEEEGKSKVMVDIDLRFRDVKAAVPIWTNELSYVNNALIRPIVAFMKCVILHLPPF